MTPERWQRVSDLYEAVLDRPASEREAFVADACAGDSALRREIQSLLAQDDHHSPLDRPVWAPEELLAADYNAGSAPRMRLAAGTRLGPYEIQSALGAGGMGEVYRGRDTRLDRAVAIKVLGPDVAADAGFRARFDREAKTISQLDHPNICPLFDVGDEGGIAFLVMPLLEGESLLDRLRRGPMPLAEALRIATSLASALTYAHGRGVLHRDIKPQNVLLLPDGRVQLLDFGVAKSQTLETADAEADTTPALTRFGQTLGTPEYMSPEQLAARVVDGRSDMFSLGILVYLLVTGAHPFRGSTAAVTSAAIINNPAPLLPAAMADLDRVVQRMLQKRPADRYPTMADCLADLRALASPFEALHSRPVARRAKAAGLIGAAAVAAAIMFVVLRDRTAAPPSPADAPAAPAATAAPVAANVIFWLDVGAPGSPDGVIQSAGDHVYPRGARFKLHLVPAAPGHVYVLSDDQPLKAIPTGLALVFAQSTGSSGGGLGVTTDWLAFTAGPARDHLWLVWSAKPIPELDALRAALEREHVGSVRDAGTAASLRARLAAAAAQATFSIDPAAARAAIAGSGTLVAYRLELQHD